MPKSRKGPSTQSDIESFVASHLYTILQTESIWLQIGNGNLPRSEADQKLLEAYADWFWKGEKAWKRRCSIEDRRRQAKRFYSALRCWLEKRNLFNYSFQHLDAMMFSSGYTTYRLSRRLCLEFMSQRFGHSRM